MGVGLGMQDFVKDAVDGLGRTAQHLQGGQLIVELFNASRNSVMRAPTDLLLGERIASMIFAKLAGETSRALRCQPIASQSLRWLLLSVE